jgi:hypothetical protein
VTVPVPIIAGDVAEITFDRFDLPAYDLFLRIKQLPESRVTFDWRADTYTVTTPARFAAKLGVSPDVVSRNTPDDLSPHLFDYQRWAVARALEARRFALWLDTGLGKTACYLEWADQVRRLTQYRGGSWDRIKLGKVLILAPLAVLPQIVEEQRRFRQPGSQMRCEILRTREELVDWLRDPDHNSQVVKLCNYEKFIAGEIPELRHLGGLVCDESSILKTGGGTIKWNLIKSARGIEYKLSCTATPAPNDAMEYASQAAFLETIRTEGEVLWTYFHKGKNGEWSVKPHARAAFYRFMASWSLYLRDPKQFGFGDILASLPDPEIIEERIPLTDPQREAMSTVLAEHRAGLFGDQLGITARTKLAQIARGFVYRGKGSERTAERIPSRKVQWVARRIVEEAGLQGRQVLVWTTFDEEGQILREMLPETVRLLDGSQSDDERQEILAAFRAGEFRTLISKPSLIGYGLNLQFVETMIFSGFDDSFERVYQAIRRAYRFGQTRTVRVYFPYVPELEGMIFENIRQKEARFLQEVSAQEELYRVALQDELTGVR